MLLYVLGSGMCGWTAMSDVTVVTQHSPRRGSHYLSVLSFCRLQHREGETTAVLLTQTLFIETFSMLLFFKGLLSLVFWVGACPIIQLSEGLGGIFLSHVSFWIYHFLLTKIKALSSSPAPASVSLHIFKVRHKKV